MPACDLHPIDLIIHSNTTPLSRPESSTGANLLPLARIQKIIQSDDEIEQCSKNAAFAIAIAAEEFIWHLVESSQMVAKATGRGSRKAQSLMYADIGTIPSIAASARIRR